MMYKKMLAALGALTMLGMPAATLAQENVLPYTYVEAGFAYGEALDYDAQGYKIVGSRALNNFVYASGSYTTMLTDEVVSGGLDAAVDEIAMGLGIHTRSEGSPDFLAEIHYVRAEIELGGAQEKESGYRSAVGFRLPGGDLFEIVVKLNYTKLLDERETGFELGGRVKLGEKNSLGLGYNGSLNVDAFGLDLRMEL